MRSTDGTAGFKSANRILEEVLDVPEGQREARILRRCGENQTLYNRILQLLTLESKLGGFLSKSVFEHPELLPGDVLDGRFQITEKLGEGGMGSVFLADDVQLGQVALKTIRNELRDDAQAFERFRNEIRLARGIRHPNLCPVFDLHTLHYPAGGVIHAFTMKYLPGETLAERLSRGPIPATCALNLARGIGAGIDALHAEGIVHRDLKPGNIILTEDRGGAEIPVITDFGIADTEMSCRFLETAPIGSPDYMAPEQLAGGRITRAVDVYAFGRILFEMIAGRPEQRNAGGATSWDQALSKAMADDPAERPESAGALVALIEPARRPGDRNRRVRGGTRSRIVHFPRQCDRRR